MDELQEADSLLQMAIRNVDSRKQMDTTQVQRGFIKMDSHILLPHMLCFFVNQEVQQSIQEQKILMKNVLEDARLVTLQREGGALLARMKREEFRFPQSEDYRYETELFLMYYFGILACSAKSRKMSSALMICCVTLCILHLVPPFDIQADGASLDSPKHTII